MEAKKVKIKIHMTRKPGDLGYKTEFIRKTYHLPVSDILVFAKERGLNLSPAEIYTARSLDKKKRAAEIPQLSAPAPLKLLPAKKAPKRVVRFSAFDTPTPERDFLKLMLRIGTIRASELVSNAPELIRKEFGIG